MKKIFVEAICTLIFFYQKCISPILGPRCRFYPSCSQYTVLALRKYGLWKGCSKALWRILRCHPLSKGGIDEP